MSPVLRWSRLARAVSLLAFLLAATTPTRAQSADVAAIKALNEAWIHSYLTKDTAIVARIWADDFVLINPAGQRMYKRDGIKAFSNPATHFLSSVVDTAEVHVTGNLGYIHARAAFTTVDAGGKKTNGKTDYLDVYEKRKGHWVCIAAHVIYLGSK